MKGIRQKIWNDKGLAFLLYSLGLAAILPYALHYVNNPDAFQYISIAQKIASGHFALAVNAYWSPLISWLISIPVFFGVDGVLAFKLVQIIIGFFTIGAWFSLLALMGLGEKYSRILGIVVIPFILNFAILHLTADLLFLTLILCCLNIFLKNEWMNTRRGLVCLAVLGAFMFFAKAFGFPLFIALLLLSLLISFFDKSGKHVFKNTFAVLAVFISFSSLWILPLSLKYGSFTLSKVAAFNLSKEVSPIAGQIVQLPILKGPLIAPSDEYAISAWESPGENAMVHPLHPFHSREDFTHYSSVIKRNFQSIWYYDFRHQLGGIFILILFFFLLLRKKREAKYNRNFVFLIFTVLLIYGGYSLILVHTRYTWICTLIMVLLSVWMLEKMAPEKDSRAFLARLIMIIAVLIAVKRPLKEILFTKDFSMPALWIGKSIVHPFETMSIHYRPEKQLNKTIQALKNYPELKGRIASLRSNDGARDNYSSSLFIAQKFNTQYFGLLDNSISAEMMKDQLQNFQVDILLVWDQTYFPAKDQNWLKEIYYDPELGLRVFGLF